MTENYQNLLQSNRIIPRCCSSNNNEIISVGISHESLFNSPFTIDEIKNSVKSLKANKSPDLGCLISKMINRVNDKILARITKLFNAVWDSEIYPKKKGHGTIGPILKHGNKAEPRN